METALCLTSAKAHTLNQILAMKETAKLRELAQTMGVAARIPGSCCNISEDDTVPTDQKKQKQNDPQSKVGGVDIYDPVDKAKRIRRVVLPTLSTGP